MDEQKDSQQTNLIDENDPALSWFGPLQNCCVGFIKTVEVSFLFLLVLYTSIITISFFYNAVFDGQDAQMILKRANKNVDIIFQILIFIEIIGMLRIAIDERIIPPIYPIMIGITSLIREIIKPNQKAGIDNIIETGTDALAILILAGVIMIFSKIDWPTVLGIKPNAKRGTAAKPAKPGGTDATDAS